MLSSARLSPLVRLLAILATGTVALWLLLVTTPTSPADAATVPVPVTPSGLPSGLERLAPYVPANSCDPRAKPGATALAQLLVRTYGSHYGVDRACGTDALPTSEHYDGRAVDFFLSVRDAGQKAEASAFLGWLFASDAAGNRYANARRLGVMYVIWNNKMWGSYRATEGWRPYSSCASHPGSAYDTSCHRNHIHLSLSWDGAMKRTSFWTNQVAAVDYGPCRAADLNWAGPYSVARTTPCPSYPHVSAPAGASALRRTLVTYSGMQLRRGATGPVVSAVQRVVGATADGSFGPATQAAVTTWQQAHAVAATGVVDAPTWRAILSATVEPSAQAPQPRHPELTKYRKTVLRKGSHGAAVTALKRRLGINPPGTRFGPRADAKVRAFQRSHRLPVTGVVASRTWAALGA